MQGSQNIKKIASNHKKSPISDFTAQMATLQTDDLQKILHP